MAPATPVPASTVLLIRDGAAGLEVFMVERHHQIDFATGALVFPGGRVDDADGDPSIPARCASADQGMRAIEVATIRESFEECGILLARRQGDDALIPGAELHALAHYRQSLEKGDTNMATFCATEGLELAIDQLVRFAHWITPDMMPKRFDTHFYLAPAPADHVGVHDGHESVDSVWTTPVDAMAAEKSGSRTIIFPTLMNLEKLGAFDRVEEALAVTRETDIVTVLPYTDRREDGNYLCIPAEAGYSVVERKMERTG